MRTRTLLVGGVAVFAVGVLAGLVGPDATVFRIVRARTYEVWDRDRGGKVLDVEDELARLRSRVESVVAAQDTQRDTVTRLYNSSSLKTTDEVAARQTAESAALANELTALRAELAHGREQAASNAERARFDQFLSDSHREMGADETRRELKRIRRALEGP